MITSAFIPGTEDKDEAFAIRREVFVDEQRWPEGEAFDEFEDNAMHLMVYADEAPAAAGRIWHDGSVFRIGRIAVLKKFRGQKLGDLVMRLLLYKAFNSGAETVHIGAQKYIVPFYQKFGLKECGEEYEQAGIPHIEMKVGKDDLVYPSDCCKG